MNLTESQKEVARWLSQQVLDGHIPEDLLVFFVADGIIIMGYEMKPSDPPFSLGALDALASEQMLVSVSRKSNQGQFAVKALLHKAVASNFGELENPIAWSKEEAEHIARFIAKHFDQDELKNLCFDLGINPDEIPGEALSGRAYNVVIYAAANGKLVALVLTIKQHRPFFSSFS